MQGFNNGEGYGEAGERMQSREDQVTQDKLGLWMINHQEMWEIP